MNILKLFLSRLIALKDKFFSKDEQLDKPPKITEQVVDYVNPNTGLLKTPKEEDNLKRMLPYYWAKIELEKGIHDVPGPDANPRIIFYHAFTSLKATSDEIPWCSAFMNAAAMCSGLPGTGSAAASSWLSYGDEGDGSQGDIAVFKRKGGHHVAFVNKDYKHEPIIECLGGNQGKAVSVELFGVSNLLTFRRF